MKTHDQQLDTQQHLYKGNTYTWCELLAIVTAVYNGCNKGNTGTERTEGTATNLSPVQE